MFAFCQQKSDFFFVPCRKVESEISVVFEPWTSPGRSPSCCCAASHAERFSAASADTRSRCHLLISAFMSYMAGIMHPIIANFTAVAINTGTFTAKRTNRRSVTSLLVHTHLDKYPICFEYAAVVKKGEKKSVK